MELCPLFSLRAAQRALTQHRKLCVPLASTQTFTPPCIHTHTCAHINPRACMHTWIHCRWTHKITCHRFLSYIQMRELQLDSTVHFDSDLSSMLNLSVKFIFILMRPAAVVVAHDATQHGRKEWAIPYHTRPKSIFLLKRMQCKCCNNIADNQFLRVRIHSNNARMSRSWLIALYFTLSQQCILFKGIF